MQLSSGWSTHESQTAWRWLSIRSRFVSSRTGARTSPWTIALGSRKKYWSCGLCDDAYATTSAACPLRPARPPRWA